MIHNLVLHKNATVLAADAQDLLNQLNYILDSDVYNLMNIRLSQAAAYAYPVFQLTKALLKYEHPSQDIASCNFNAGLYFQNIGDVVWCKDFYLVYQEIYKSLLLA